MARRTPKGDLQLTWAACRWCSGLFARLKKSGPQHLCCSDECAGLRIADNLARRRASPEYIERKSRRTQTLTWAACCVCSSLFSRLPSQAGRIACSPKCQRRRERETERSQLQVSPARLARRQEYQRAYYHRRRARDPSYRQPPDATGCLWAACSVCSGLFLRARRGKRSVCSKECEKIRRRAMSNAAHHRRMKDAACLEAKRASQRAYWQRNPPTPERRAADRERQKLARQARKAAGIPHKYNKVRNRERYILRRDTQPEVIQAQYQREAVRRRVRRETDPAYREKRLQQGRAEYRRRKVRLSPEAWQAELALKAARHRTRAAADPTYREAYTKQKRAWHRRRTAAEATAAAKVTIGLLAQLTKDLEDGTHTNSAKRRR